MGIFSEIKAGPVQVEEEKLRQVLALHRAEEAKQETAAVEIAIDKLKLTEREQLVRMLIRSGHAVESTNRGTGGSIIFTLPLHSTGSDKIVEFFFDPEGTLRDAESR